MKLAIANTIGMLGKGSVQIDSNQFERPETMFDCVRSLGGKQIHEQQWGMGFMEESNRRRKDLGY